MANTRPSTTASTTGAHDFDGMSRISSQSASSTVEDGVSWPSSRTSSPSAKRCSSSSRSLRSHIAYGDETLGMTGKLYEGGGDDTDHSSVSIRLSVDQPTSPG